MFYTDDRRNILYFDGFIVGDLDGLPTTVRWRLYEYCKLCRPIDVMRHIPFEHVEREAREFMQCRTKTPRSAGPFGPQQAGNSSPSNVTSPQKTLFSGGWDTVFDAPTHGPLSRLRKWLRLFS